MVDFHLNLQYSLKYFTVSHLTTFNPALPDLVNHQAFLTLQLSLINFPIINFINLTQLSPPQNTIKSLNNISLPHNFIC